MPDKISEVEEYFGQVSQIMKKNFEISKITTKHKGRRGTESEIILINFLRNYLPKKFSIGSGFLLSQDGERSKELDVIIFDSFQAPALYYRETHQILPIDSTYATIEVKSYLNKKAILNSSMNISSVKTLQRHKDKMMVYGFVFSFTSTSLTSLKNNLDEYYLENNIPLSERIDTICVLNKGLIYLNKDDEFTALYTKDSSLLAFYIQLVNSYLDSTNIIKTDICDYISDTEFLILE